MCARPVRFQGILPHSNQHVPSRRCRGQLAFLAVPEVPPVASAAGATLLSFFPIPLLLLLSHPDPSSPGAQEGSRTAAVLRKLPFPLLTHPYEDTRPQTSSSRGSVPGLEPLRCRGQPGPGARGVMTHRASLPRGRTAVIAGSVPLNRRGAGPANPCSGAGLVGTG